MISILPPRSDSARVDFLLALDNGDLEVTDWEAEFIEKFLRRPDARTAWFSQKERTIIDALWDKYGTPED